VRLLYPIRNFDRVLLQLESHEIPSCHGLHSRSLLYPLRLRLRILLDNAHAEVGYDRQLWLELLDEIACVLSAQVMRDPLAERPRHACDEDSAMLVRLDDLFDELSVRDIGDHAGSGLDPESDRTSVGMSGGRGEDLERLEPDLVERRHDLDYLGL